MKKLNLIWAVCFLLIFQAGSAKAAMITFDDYDDSITGNAPIAYDYKGFVWEGGTNPPSIFNKTIHSDLSSGVKSGVYAMYAYGIEATPTSIYRRDENDNFDFIIAFFSINSMFDKNIFIFGYDNGIERYQDNFLSSKKTPILREFNWTGIDEIKIYLPVLEYAHGFTMDNFVVNEHSATPTPEPTTAILGLMSLLGLSGLRKRK